MHKNNLLATRAATFAAARSYFAAQGVLEVDTPLCYQSQVSDPFLSQFSTAWCTGQTLYLQTSPEYAMKRLLASGSGSIYQLGKAFRNEPCGRFHHPEFTLLEWYRLDFELTDMIADTLALMQTITPFNDVEQVTYQQVFQEEFLLDPLQASLNELVTIARTHLLEVEGGISDKDEALNLLFSQIIEPKLGQQAPLVVTHFPASQAALAKLDPDNPMTAQRFEIYWQGIELANGYHECTDPLVLAERFAQDNHKRQQLGLATIPVDEAFLAAQSDIPPCSGVALGLDRLLMIKMARERLADVLPLV